MSTRRIQQIIPAHETSDGAGVRLKRSLGQSQRVRHDPFLMLDAFFTDDAADYIAGFPAHPHRGFETVTYMIEGHMLHEDHLGNRGNLQTGGVQWMTAGRGIIHSEMPQQNEGRMRGFQLWLNLPAAEKMKPAGYRDIRADEIPVADLADGGTVKVIAGSVTLAGKTIDGPVNSGDARLSTDPLYLDIHLPAGSSFSQSLPDNYSAFVYPYEGEITVGEGSAAQALGSHQAGLLSKGEQVLINSAKQDSKLLLLAGKAIGEPVVQYGPFVMNTVDEVEQAIRDYQEGRLTAA